MNAHACLYPEFYEHHPWVMTFVLITFLLFVILSFSWHNKHKGNGLNHGRPTPNGQSRIYMLQRRKVCRAVSSNKNVCVVSEMNNRLAYGFLSNMADKDTESTILPLPI